MFRLFARYIIPILSPFPCQSSLTTSKLLMWSQPRCSYAPESESQESTHKLFYGDVISTLSRISKSVVHGMLVFQTKILNFLKVKKMTKNPKSFADLSGAGAIYPADSVETELYNIGIDTSHGRRKIVSRNSCFLKKKTWVG